MPEQTVAKELINWGYVAFSAVASILGISIKRASDKIDRHDREHASREELTKSINSVRTEISEGRKENADRIDKLTETIIQLVAKK